MKKLTTEEFIKRAKQIHGNKYDYSKVEYINRDVKICIICHVHGEFWQTPHNHLHGQNCPLCVNNNIKKNINEFVAAANNIHKNRYDYSKVNYVDNKTKVCIICPKHGEFWQTPKSHLGGNGCPKCYGNAKLTTEEFIEKAKQIHGNKYDYSKTEYVNTRAKLSIKCPRHGIFMQTPHSHLSGDGCPICKASHLENEIKLMLDENNIEYEYQKHFDWLGKQSLDFYIPSSRIAIECQGSQHYIPYDFFGGEKCLEKTKIRDKKKKELCIEHNINILYYGHHKNCIKNKKIILSKILKK